MARIDLKNCVVSFLDGFTGSAAVNDPEDALVATDTTMQIDTVASLPNSGTTIPVGVRFTVAGDSATTFTVTASSNNEVQSVDLDGASGGDFALTFDGQTTSDVAYNASAATIVAALEALSNVEVGDVAVQLTTAGFEVEFKGLFAGTDVALMTIADGVSPLSGGGGSETVTVVNTYGSVNSITFTPGLVSGSVPADDAVITFLPQKLDIKIGDGNVTYSETYNYDYEMDRGTLDTVRAGDEAPLEVNLDAVYEFIAASSGGTVTPYEAIHGSGEASEWVSSSSDLCEPYAVDLQVVYTPPCGGEDIETTLLPDFRVESIEVDYGGASLSLSGKCNATAPTITRTAQ